MGRTAEMLLREALSWRDQVIDRRYSADELRAVIVQAEALIGDTLDDLLQRHRQAATGVATSAGGAAPALAPSRRPS